MKKFLIGALALATLATSADAIRLFGILFDNDNVGLILGSDKDEWGCVPSAGYTWCNDTQSCLPINQVCSNYSSTL